jgi:CubicO group peptidase (beta-lactamase class C family)
VSAVWNYNGGGTDLLGSIIERVSGKPFDVFAREALFQPLGITDWEWKTYQNGKFSPAAGLRPRPLMSESGHEQRSIAEAGRSG